MSCMQYTFHPVTQCLLSMFYCSPSIHCPLSWKGSDFDQQEGMSRNHPEKRSFLHSTSDTDSDIDNEQGWADVGLANQLGRGSYGAPKKNSYVTHDFTVFRAVKLDPDQTEATSESNIMRNKEPGDKQEVEGSSQYSVEGSAPFIQGSPSESSHRSQESKSQSDVLQSDPHGVEPSGRDSHIERGIDRSSPQRPPFENEGLAVIETNVSIFSELEKWPSLQFPFSGIGILEDDSLGGDTNINSSIESKLSTTILLSEIAKAGEEPHGRTSHSNDAERQPSIESTFKGIDLLREDVSGRDDYINNSSERQPSLQSSVVEVETSRRSVGGTTSQTVHGNEKWSLLYLGPLGDDGGKNSSRGSGNEGQSFSKSPFFNTETAGDLMREEISNIDRSSERQSPPHSSVLETETFRELNGGRTSHTVHGHEQWSTSYLDPLGDEGLKSSSLGSGSEGQSSSKSCALDTETVGDSMREEASGRKRNTNNISEGQSPPQSLLVIETIGGLGGGRSSHSVDGDEKRPLSYLDPLGDEGGKSSSLGSGNERQLFSKSPLLDTETVGQLMREEISGRYSYINSSSEKQSPLQSPVVEMEALGGSGEGRNSHSVHGNERWSLSYLDPPGEEDGKSTSLGSGHETQSFSRSPLLDTETVGDLLREEISEKNIYINNSSEKQSPLLQSSTVEMEIFRQSDGGRTSHSVCGNEKWLDPLGDECGKSNFLGSGNERQSSHLLDTETLGEPCVRHGHVGSMSERCPVPKPKLIDTDIQTEYNNAVGSNVSNAESFDILKEPTLYGFPPSPLKELKGASMTSDRQASHLVTVSNTDHEVGGNNMYLSEGNERRPLRKECLLHEQAEPSTDSRRTSVVLGGTERRPSGKELALDEQSEPLRDIKRGSVMSGHQVSPLPSTSEMHNELESMSERTRGRGSVNHSSRQVSRIISPPSEADSDLQNRERDEYGEADTPEFTPRQSSLHRRNSIAAQVGERFPPEWALLLLGCLLGLATGLSVVLFNKGVHLIHDIAWAGTPKDGAAWFRLQQLINIWHRVLLLPVVGGVVVGMMHAVLGILDQVNASRPPQPRHTVDWLAGIKPTIKASQAMVSLGTGCSLGPEGPSVDIGRAWANGLATIMKNNKERRIALVAAGAAAGISAGFNAPVSGMFFAIETVLRPQNAENSPPLTTAMIILASVISSTVSQILLEETPAFTVPTYELRSAAELPLYLLLGGVCGVVSVIFVRLTAYFTEVFEFIRDQIGVPPTVTPAIGGLVTGVIALKYPGVLYWGFYNVDEILHSGKSAIAPGAGLVTQLICAKVVATAFSKGSGLVGGVYAPSLFIGAAVGSVYGTIAGKIIGAALPGQDTVAHPQAYALVGMAALLAAVCSVPLTSVLLLFELTKDYHILLPLMGGIGVAIWVAAVAKQTTEKHFATSVPFGGRSFQHLGTDEGVVDHSGHEQLVWRRTGSGTELELCRLDDYEGPNVVSDAELKDSIKVSQAMSKTFVKVQAIATVKETIGQILLKQQRCALVVDENDLLEGIFTFSDLEKEVMRAAESSYRGHRAVVDVDKMLVAAMCSGKGDNQGQDTDLVVCFPDMSLRAIIEIMDSSGFKQLPVVARAGKRWQDEGRHVVGLIDRDAIPRCVREEASKRIAALLAKDVEDDDGPLLDGH